MKDYPLDICDVSINDHIVMSRGHHDIHEFMKAVREEGIEYQLCVPEHRWAKVVPDSTGEFNHIYVFVKESVRGSFPVTYSWGANKEDTYEVKFPSGKTND